MHDIIKRLKSEIKKVDKPENQINIQRWFKEELDDPISLRGGILKKISADIFKEIKHLSKKEILDICDELLETNFRYKKYYAFDWSEKVRDKFTKSDFTRFEKWLKNYVDDWGACDSLCFRSLGYVVAMYPELVTKTKKWTKSKNRWLRRAAAVSLIKAVLDHKLLDEVFITADILMMDQDDMVQKGYGWMLKEASNRYPDEVFEYVMKHKDKMPRTSLRYAIEKYPKAKRKEAMRK